MGRYRRGEQVVAWALVAVQLVLLVGLVVAPGARGWTVPWWLSVVAGVMVAAGGLAALLGAAGLGAGLTASPLPAASATLRTTGVYGCVRHPIYSGLLLAGAGVVVFGGRPTRALVWVGLLVVLWGKSRFEERRLTARFPGYRAYAVRTPRLLPRPRRCRPAHRTAIPGIEQGDRDG